MMVVERLKNFLPKGQLKRGILVLAGGTALGQLIAALASPILTRFYSPDDFGILATFISVFALLLTVNSLRYELAITLPEDDVDAASITVLVLLLVVATTAVFGLVFWLWGSPLLDRLNLTALHPYLGLLLVSLLGAGIYQAFNYWAVRKKAFNPVARTKLIQSLTQVVTQLLLGFMRFQAFGLIIGYTLGQFGGSTTLARLTWTNSAATFRQVTWMRIREVAWRYRKFPIFMSWASLVNAAGLQLPALVLVTLYGPAVAGWFALGQRIVAIPMTLIGTSVSQVYFSAASQMAYENPAGLDSLFSRSARNLFIVGLVPMVFLALTGPWLFEIILGAEWRTSGEFVQLMTPMFLTQFVVSTLSQTLLVLERPDLQSAWDVVRLILVIIIFLSASAMRFSPEVAIGLYSLGMTTMYIVLFVVNKYLVRERRRLHTHR